MNGLGARFHNQSNWEFAMAESIDPPDDTVEHRNAAALKETQEHEAVRLKKAQIQTATVLLNKLVQEEISIALSPAIAATALKSSQKAAAVALKSSHANHAKELDKAQTSSATKQTEKDQVIFWLSGGYILDGKPEDSP